MTLWGGKIFGSVCPDVHHLYFMIYLVNDQQEERAWKISRMDRVLCQFITIFQPVFLQIFSLILQESVTISRGG